MSDGEVRWRITDACGNVKAEGTFATPPVFDWGEFNDGDYVVDWTPASIDLGPMVLGPFDRCDAEEVAVAFGLPVDWLPAKPASG